MLDPLSGYASVRPQGVEGVRSKNTLNDISDMERFTVRRWNASDAHDLASGLNNKKIWDNCRDCLPYPYTETDAERFIRLAESQEPQANYCIEVDRKAAGNISFERGADVERFNAELGYWLAEPYWNRGIMTEALRRTIRDYFRQTDVERIYANVYASNSASARVLEKAGFRLCGTHRRACFKNGRFVDSRYYELLRADLESRP